MGEDAGKEWGREGEERDRESVAPRCYDIPF